MKNDVFPVLACLTPKAEIMGREMERSMELVVLITMPTVRDQYDPRVSELGGEQTVVVENGAGNIFLVLKVGAENSHPEFGDGNLLCMGADGGEDLGGQGGFQEVSQNSATAK